MGKQNPTLSSVGALQAAISQDDLDLVIEAVERLKDDERFKVLAIGLAIACDKQKLAIAKYLLQIGADPNAATTGKAPPLLRAVESCKSGPAGWDIVRLLLEHGANPETQDRDGRTALMNADSRELAELLLDNGANVNATDREQRTALMYAHRLDIVELLIARGADVNAKDKYNYGALSTSIVSDKDAAITYHLIDHGADIEATDQMNRSVLVTAVWRNRRQLVQDLLARGAKVDRLDDRQRNVLHHIAQDSDRGIAPEEHVNVGREIMQLLLAKATTDDLEARDLRGRTPLHWAAAVGNAFVAEALLSAKVKTNPLEQHNRTPLHLAVKYTPLILEAKVDQVAPVEDKTSSINADVSPRKVQRKQEQMRKTKAKQAKEQQERLARQALVSQRHDQVIDMLLAGTPVDTEADGGWTVLHTACATQPRVAVLDKLLAKKPDLNKRTHSGKTSFHLACEFGKTALVERLLSQLEVKVKTTDNFGNTPLLSAAICGHRDVLDLLAPWTASHIARLSEDELRAAQQFNATVVDFGDYKRGNVVDKRTSVYDLIYSNPRPLQIQDDTISHAAPTQNTAVKTVCDGSDTTKFRWIHLPVNSVAWCQELLTKRFIEEGALDVDAFRSLERSFMHQHRGQKVHSSYMRPMCQTIHRQAPVSEQEVEKEETNEDVGERVPDGDAKATLARFVLTGPQASDQNGSIHVEVDPERVTLGAVGESNFRPPVPRRSSTALSTMDGRLAVPATDPTTTNGIKRSTTGESIEDRQPGRSRKRERQTTQTRQRRQSSAPRVVIDDLSACAEYNMFLFAPYLHFETVQEREEMQRAVDRAGYPRDHGRQAAIAFEDQLHKRKEETPEEILLRAHLHSHTNALHVRRTLDQSFYRNIDTTVRDADQGK
jgi:ankyrin repeat protein